MKPVPRLLHPRQSQAGMTLIELLVALSIGLFIIGAALMVFQSTSGIGRQISELTQIRQEGAHAFRVIGKQVREAGSVEPEYVSTNNNFRFGEYNWTNGTPVAAWTPPSGSDFLSISQQVQTGGTHKELLRNCLGEKVSTSNRRSDFYLQDGNLRCVTGSNVGGQPIISNVNAFRVRYRVSNASGTASSLSIPPRIGRAWMPLKFALTWWAPEPRPRATAITSIAMVKVCRETIACTSCSAICSRCLRHRGKQDACIEGKANGYFIIHRDGDCAAHGSSGRHGVSQLPVQRNRHRQHR